MVRIKNCRLGQYNFEIAFSSTAEKIATVGNWDVTAALQNKVRIIKNGLLKGSSGNTEKATGNFTLASSQKIEIRTWAQKNMDLKVIYTFELFGCDRRLSFRLCVRGESYCLWVMIGSPQPSVPTHSDIHRTYYANYCKEKLDQQLQGGTMAGVCWPFRGVAKIIIY